MVGVEGEHADHHHSLFPGFIFVFISRKRGRRGRGKVIQFFHQFITLSLSRSFVRSCSGPTNQWTKLRNNLFICLIKTPASTAIHRFNAQGSSKPIAVLNLSVFYLFYLPTSQTHPMPPPSTRTSLSSHIFIIVHSYTQVYQHLFAFSLNPSHKPNLTH